MGNVKCNFSPHGNKVPRAWAQDMNKILGVGERKVRTPKSFADSNNETNEGEKDGTLDYKSEILSQVINDLKNSGNTHSFKEFKQGVVTVNYDELLSDSDIEGLANTVGDNLFVFCDGISTETYNYDSVHRQWCDSNGLFDNSHYNEFDKYWNDYVKCIKRCRYVQCSADNRLDSPKLKKRCSICGKEFRGFGYGTGHLNRNEVCCYDCYYRVVMKNDMEDMIEMLKSFGSNFISM